jgi:serine/threonine protein kinase/peptidoglycan hydrolase-like protein with peptidoglycan-binding domain
VSADSDAGAASNDFVSLRPDQLVGRYRIVSVLGQGSFGITYRAIDSELGREVAIKEYLPASLAVRQDGTTVVPRSGSAAADFAWGRDRFIAEGRTLAAFHRLPGVVQVHDFLEANGTAYLVMELVRGRTLLEQIERQGPLDTAGLDGILSTLLDGLEQVHGVGFLHRDIKPANVLVDGNGHPVLIDFGASRAAVAGRSQAMTAIFTPGYAAVEQFTAATQGPWTDIYGLAATVHHAITGRAPPNAIDRIIDDTYVALADSGLPFPRTLLAGIDAGLAVRAADRPQSIAAWRKILSATPVGAGAAPATVVMPRAATAAAATAVAASRKRPAILLGAGVAVLCLLAGGWFAIGSRPSGPAASESSSPASSSTASSSAAGPSSPSPSAQPAVVAAPAQDRAQEQLEEARRAQRAAFEEAARLRAEADARRKMDEEAALRRKIEEEMRQKAEAEEAARRRAVEDAKRQAAAEMAAAAAARQQAESDARSKAEAEAAVRLKAEEADLKGAEAAEAALRLGQPDRQRIQTALTALGFPTSGNDGVFGARSREMIAAWQKKAGRAATGYLSADSQAALLREAAPALARHDEEQRKLAAAVQPQPVAPTKVATPCEGTYRVEWCRAAYQGFPPGCWNANATISNGAISGGWTSQGSTDRQTFSGSIDAGGDVRVTYNGVGQQTHVNRSFTVYMTGRVEGNVLRIAGRAGPNGRDFSATIQCR